MGITRYPTKNKLPMQQKGCTSLKFWGWWGNEQMINQALLIGWLVSGTILLGNSRLMAYFAMFLEGVLCGISYCEKKGKSGNKYEEIATG